MTIDEFIERVSTYPRDAHLTGYVEEGTDRIGVLVVWNVRDQIRTVFIETKLLPADLRAARPKKAGEGGKS